MEPNFRVIRGMSVKSCVCMVRLIKMGLSGMIGTRQGQSRGGDEAFQFNLCRPKQEGNSPVRFAGQSNSLEGPMKRIIYVSSFVMAILVAPSAAPLAQDVFAYPNQGQSQEQQQQDQFECFNWSKQQSGFDPMVAPTASTPPPQDQSTGPGALGGAAVGAGAGAIGGAIGGNTGKGAAIGAIAGGLFGGMKSNKQNKKNQQSRQDWERQQAAQYQQGRDNYNRAYSACMSARDYTIS